MNVIKLLKLKIILFLSSILVCFTFLCYINSYSAAECVLNSNIEQNYQFIQTFVTHNNLLLINNQVPPLVLSHSDILQLAQDSLSFDQLIEFLQQRIDEHVQDFENTEKLKYLLKYSCMFFVVIYFFI